MKAILGSQGVWDVVDKGFIGMILLQRQERKAWPGPWKFMQSVGREYVRCADDRLNGGQRFLHIGTL